MIGGLRKSTSTLALCAAAGLFAGGVAMPSANAADLGGDCCADLEERVAELEATTARKGNRRVSLTISGQVNRAVMFWDDGSRSDVFSVDNAQSRSGFQFDGSARINPNVTAGFSLVVGLGLGGRSQHVSQFDTTGGDEGFVNPKAVTNNFAGTSNGFMGGDGVPNIELANWYLDHKQLGRLTVGRINTAAAGSSIVDLGGAGVIANANFGLWNNGFAVLSGGATFGSIAGGITTVGGVLVVTPTTAKSWNSVYGGNIISINGLSRAEGVSYTTPTWAGFSLQAAWAENAENPLWDVALRYAGEMGGFRVAAAIAYGMNYSVAGLGDANDIPGNDQCPPNAPLVNNNCAEIHKTQGSASILHIASGLYLSGAYGVVSYDGTSAGESNAGNPALGHREDTTFWYLNGGISKNWTGLGNTVIYGEYMQVDDGGTGTTGWGFGAGKFGAGVLTDSQATFWGIGIVQNIDAAAMELFLSYRGFSGDVSVGATTLDLDEQSIVMSGARIRF